MTTMTTIRRLWPALLLLSCLPALAADCPPTDWPRERLDALKAGGFEVADAAGRGDLALALVDCLGDPDPTLRDGIAYEALATWLRADALERDTRRGLMQALLVRVADDAPDGEGFAKPFAALVLAEVARTDRIEAWLTPAERQALLDAATAYVAGIRDHRGFTDGEGWRHAVAHGSDWLMQLALNPALDRPQLDAILAAVATQVAPADGHAYVHGESERLARPALFVLFRSLHTPEDWAAWLDGVSAPAPLADWREAFGSETGLARRHNVRAFLRALYTALDGAGNEALAAYRPAVLEALRRSG